MSTPAAPKGALFLVPTPLDFGCSPQDPVPLGLLLPDDTIQVAARLVHWVAENAKSTRAFLKRVENEDYFDTHTNFTPFSLKD